MRNLPRLPSCWRGLMLLGLLFSVASGSVQAQYLWRDKAGQMHASDLPPPADVPAKDVLRRPSAGRSASPTAAAPPAASAASASAASRAGVDPEIDARRAKSEQAGKARAKAEEERLAAQQAENCRRARAQMASLDSGQRLARVNATGERVVLDDNARADEADMARRVMASDCR